MIRKSKLPKVDKRKGSKRDSYNIPDEVDLEILAQSLEKLSKGLDSEGKAKPIDEQYLKNIFRSAVRKRWMAAPTKLHFLESGLEPDYDPNTRRRFKIQCNICKQYFTKAEIEIDHIKQEQEFDDWSKALLWAKAILDVGAKDLQRLCQGCHLIKSHCDTLGLDFTKVEDWKYTVADKKAIEICKKKEDKQWLTGKGLTPAGNAKLRRNQIVQELLNEHSN